MTTSKHKTHNDEDDDLHPFGTARSRTFVSVDKQVHYVTLISSHKSCETARLPTNQRNENNRVPTYLAGSMSPADQ
jgi:hypothetical protein